MRNLSSAENLVIDILQYKPPFSSKATQWGINKEPLARKGYEQRCKKEHNHFSVSETGLLVSSKYPFLAASPDGVVECSCHGKGCVEMKCTWSHRDKTVQEAAEEPGTCLIITSDKTLKLKTSHIYYAKYNSIWKPQILHIVIFFYCTTCDSHKERILYDKKFWGKSLPKAKAFFEKCIVPERLTGKLRQKMEIRCFIKELLNELFREIFKS